jgi:hypothetical protein
MNCADVRDRLPSLLYGDLKAAEAAEVEKHREACPACQREFEVLQSLRRSLDTVPAPIARVDLPRLYAEAARLQQKQTRRWRRAAVALLGAAAVLLLVLGLKLELRLEAHQLVVRWGAAPETVSSAPETPTLPQFVHVHPPTPAITSEEFQLMKDLIHALAADADTRDRQWQEEVATLRARLAGLQSHSQQSDRLVAALYTAQFGTRDQGERP